MCVCLQIYSQYVEVSDALQQEKDENIRLKQYLDQILKVHLRTVIVEFKHFVTFDTMFSKHLFIITGIRFADIK